MQRCTYFSCNIRNLRKLNNKIWNKVSVKPQNQIKISKNHLGQIGLHQAIN